MKSIQLNISDADYAYFKSANKQDLGFVRQALEEKILREKRENINELLKEGYQATASEDLDITMDFVQSDFDNL